MIPRMGDDRAPALLGADERRVGASGRQMRCGPAVRHGGRLELQGF